MKKIILIAAISLVSLTGFAQKFGHVSINELVQLTPDADKARAEIQAAQKEAQDTFQAMYDEYQTKGTQYQQKSETWSQAIRESKAKELQEIQNRLQEFSQSIEAELQQKQQELMAPIYDKAQKAINELAKKYNCIYVFDSSSLVYLDDTQSIDLNPEARKVLGIAEGRTLETLQAELQAQQAAAQQ